MTKDQAIADILKLMEQYGLTLEDIFEQAQPLVTAGIGGVTNHLVGRPA